MPQHYQAQKSVRIEANQHTITRLVSDFSQWPKWTPWNKVDPSISFTLGEPSSGVGAHQSWQSEWGYGEMTITSVSTDSMTFNILFNQDHIISGVLTFKTQGDYVEVNCSITGQATTVFISGYMAILSEYILTNTITLGLNNLKTIAQLTHAKQQPAMLERHNTETQPMVTPL